MFRLHNSHKLATKEDPYHIHKILGAICLCHFGYRYYLLFSRGCMNLDNTTAAVFVGIHGALSCSSLIFHIPGIRNKTAPMIYPEYRLHSILFVLRSVVCYFFVYNRFSIVYRFAACYSTMILADIVTFAYSNHLYTTTMRDMPFDKRIGEEEQRKITMMQSSQQIGATLYMLGNLDSCFSPMFAIQLAAFLMTLVRKSIIDSNAWHLLYNLSLWINAFCFFSLPIEYVLVQPVLYYAFYYWRFSFGRTPPNIFYGNKYVGWTFVFLAFYMQEQQHIGLFPDKKMANIIVHYGLDPVVRSVLIIGYFVMQINNSKGLLWVIFLPGGSSSSQGTHPRTD